MDHKNQNIFASKLNSGNFISAIGLGTWQSVESQARDAVKLTIRHGYRHIDTAFNYGNENEVGEGILTSDDNSKHLPDWDFVKTWPNRFEYFTSKGIHCTAYSCLGGHTTLSINNHTDLVDNATVTKIAKRKNRTPAQILLKWGLQRGASVIPKSVTPERIGSNFDLNGWSLSEEEEIELGNIKARAKVVQDAWIPIKIFFGDDE
ncbi:Fc.00g000990.m01.CDS01 [Cosmosporella sp. VM-42]